MTDGTENTAEKLQRLSQTAAAKAALRASSIAARHAMTSEALALLLINTKQAVIGDAQATGAWEYALCALDTGYAQVVQEAVDVPATAAA